MYYSKILFLIAIQYLECCAATSDRSDLAHSLGISTPIRKIWDQQRTLGEFDGQWVALGDSFSAGSGAGRSLDADCARSDGGYPQQLQSENVWPGSSKSEHPLQFLSCSGATMSNITKKQVPEMLKLGDSGIITLSVGANDALLSKVLLKCLTDLGNGTCDQALTAGREKLYGASLWEDYQQLIRGLTEKTGWTKGALEDRKPLIYQTGYPALFVGRTAQCDSATFNPFPDSLAPKLTQVLRRKVNLFIAEINIMLAFWTTHTNQQYENHVSPNNTSPIMFVEQDAEYTGHRFCREAVIEPATDNLDTWFSNVNKTGARASDFAGVNTQTCLMTAGDRMDMLYKCYIAKEAARNPSFNFSTAIRPDNQAGIFHPTVTGMGGVAKAVSQAMRLPARDPKPWLRILAAGDSITKGSGSPGTGGYRNYLNDLIASEMGDFEWIGSQVNWTQPLPASTQKPNEGYGGITVPGLHDVLLKPNSALDQKPNVVLLMIGTNDINRNAAVNETTRLLELLLELVWLRSGNDTLIIVSTIVPIGPSDAKSTIYPMQTPQRRVMEYNSQIKDLVNELRSAGRVINMMHTPVSQYDRYDLLHPTPLGYEKIAHSWFEAIMRAAHNGQIAERQNSTTENGTADEATGTKNTATDEKKDGKPSSANSIVTSRLSLGLLVVSLCYSVHVL